MHQQVHNNSKVNSSYTAVKLTWASKFIQNQIEQEV